MLLEFDEQRMNEFVGWIKKQKKKSKEKNKSSDDYQIQKLRKWMKQNKINEAEDKIWAIFIYTCVGGLDSAKKLYEIVPNWISFDKKKGRIRKAFKNKISPVGHRLRVIKREKGTPRKILYEKVTIDAIKSYKKLIGNKPQQQFFEPPVEVSEDRFDYFFKEITKNVKYFGWLAAWDFLERLDGCKVLSLKPKRLYIKKKKAGPKKGFNYICKLSDEEFNRLSKEDLLVAEKRLCEEVQNRLGNQMEIWDIETSLCNCKFWLSEKKKKLPC